MVVDVVDIPILHEGMLWKQRNLFSILIKEREKEFCNKTSVVSKLRQITRPALLFEKYSIFGYYLGSNSRSNSGLIFDSGLCQIPIFWTIMMITSWVEPKYLCFWPFMGHSQIITRLWCHKYKLLFADSGNNSHRRWISSREPALLIFGPNVYMIDHFLYGTQQIKIPYKVNCFFTLQSYCKSNTILRFPSPCLQDIINECSLKPQF